MKLSILICHLPEREHFMKRLNNILGPQVARAQGVEILVDATGRHMPTGTKRNLLISKAQGEYFSFVDVDDLVPMYYVNEILKAIEQKPDCITFQGSMTTSGKDEKQFIIKLGNQYIDKDGVYLRWPNHISVMKTSLVKEVKFPDTWIREDYEWSKRINDLCLLKTEVHIPLHMYKYEFDPKKPKNKHP